MMFSNKLHGRNFAKDPAVVKYRGVYYLYYSIAETDGRAVWSIGIAKSLDMESWETVGLISSTQPCEENGICAPGAIVINDQIHLFYQTYGNGKKDAICHAVSSDGINFTKDDTNPVFSPSADWCCGRAIDADVCVFKNKLYLYFATRDHSFRIQKIGGAVSALNSDFSRNTWRQLFHQSILAPEMYWEGECIEAPACVVHQDKLYLFYGGSYNCTPQQIGCACSENGMDFRRLSNLPFLQNGRENEWNSSESGHPFVFRDPDTQKIYLFYQGSGDGGNNWYISKKEIRFEDGLPVIIGE